MASNLEEALRNLPPPTLRQRCEQTIRLVEGPTPPVYADPREILRMLDERDRLADALHQLERCILWCDSTQQWGTFQGERMRSTLEAARKLNSNWPASPTRTSLVTDGKSSLIRKDTEET